MTEALVGQFLKSLTWLKLSFNQLLDSTIKDDKPVSLLKMINPAFCWVG